MKAPIRFAGPLALTSILAVEFHQTAKKGKSEGPKMPIATTQSLNEQDMILVYEKGVPRAKPRHGQSSSGESTHTQTILHGLS